MFPNSQETADLVAFTEEILNGKLHFSLQCMLYLKSCRVSILYFSIRSTIHSAIKILYRKLRIWSHLLKKSFVENFIFCALSYTLHSPFFKPLHQTLELQKRLGQWFFNIPLHCFKIA